MRWLQVLLTADRPSDIADTTWKRSGADRAARANDCEVRTETALGHASEAVTGSTSEALEQLATLGGPDRRSWMVSMPNNTKYPANQIAAVTPRRGALVAALWEGPPSATAVRVDRTAHLRVGCRAVGS